jgi:hypothetical protein
MAAIAALPLFLSRTRDLAYHGVGVCRPHAKQAFVVVLGAFERRQELVELVPSGHGSIMPIE